MEKSEESRVIAQVKKIVKIRFFIFLFFSFFMVGEVFLLFYFTYPQMLEMSLKTLLIIIFFVFFPLILITLYLLSIVVVSLLPLFNPQKYIKTIIDKGYLLPSYYRGNKIVNTIYGPVLVYLSGEKKTIDLFQMYSYTIAEIPRIFGFYNKILIDKKIISNKQEEIVALETEYRKNTYKMREEDLKFNRLNQLSERQKKKLKPKKEYSINTLSGKVNKTLDKWLEPLIEINKEKYKIISKELFLMIPQYIPVKIYLYLDKKKKVIINFE